jgi:predicted CXXCH cytochrome family protein
MLKKALQMARSTPRRIRVIDGRAGQRVVVGVVLAAAAFVVLAGGWWYVRAGALPPPLPLADVLDVGSVPPPAPPLPRPRHVVDFADGCITAACHARMAATGTPTTGTPISRTLHEPVARHACDECHGPDAGGHTYPLLRTGEALCGQCHQMSEARFKHKAIADIGCTACHDPHASEGQGGKGDGRFLLVGATVEATCGRCHPASAGEHRHGPYVGGQCEACHEPHGSDTRSLLRTGGAGGAGGVEGHCGLCHAETVARMAAAPHSHRDTERSCLTCHGGHATDWQHLQRLEPRQGCIACHGDTANTITSAKVSHDAVLTGHQCASCHDPHASSNAMMVRDEQGGGVGGVCLECHSKPVVASDGRQIPDMAAAIHGKPYTHGAVAAGECAACHNVHGGPHARLLKAINPNVIAGGGGFDLDNYALCFSCHDPNLVTSNAPEATAFRDGRGGGVNLHWAHLVVGGGGGGGGARRWGGCSACHAVHASEHPRLIAASVPYDGSTWLMRMGFKLTPDGGSCAPGCHEPSQYTR